LKALGSALRVNNSRWVLSDRDGSRNCLLAGMRWHCMGRPPVAPAVWPAGDAWGAQACGHGPGQRCVVRYGWL